MRSAFLFTISSSLSIWTAADESCSLLQVGRIATETALIAEIDGQLELPADLTAASPTNGSQAEASHLRSSLSLLQWGFSSELKTQWMVIGSASAVVGLGMAFLVGGVFCPSLPRPLVSICVIMIYIALSVSIDLLILYQKQAEGEGTTNVYKFDPTCSIILTEFIKLAFSVTLYTTNQLISGKRWMPEGLSISDVSLFALPALFFTANNIMVFVAIGGNDASAFGVFRDTMILWTALIWKAVFGSSLGDIRLIGIAVIFAGLVVNRLGSLSAATFNWAFLLVMLMTVTNATGSVFNEYALKWNKALDINFQNAVLYALCIMLSIMVLAIRSPGHLKSAGAFFEGFTNWTVLMVCLQASAGLLVSRLLKYADSVYKTIGTCLRGPTLVLAAPVIIGSKKDIISLISALIVATGCLTYLTQGPLTQATKGCNSSGDKIPEASTLSGSFSAPAKKGRPAS